MANGCVFFGGPRELKRYLWKAEEIFDGNRLMLLKNCRLSSVVEVEINERAVNNKESAVNLYRQVLARQRKQMTLGSPSSPLAFKERRL